MIDLVPYKEDDKPVSPQDIDRLYSSLAHAAVSLRDSGALDQARGVAHAKLLIDVWWRSLGIDKPTELS